MKRRALLISIICLVIILGVLFYIFKKNNIIPLKKEINNAYSSLFDSNITYDELQTKYEKKITSKTELETRVEEYILDLKQKVDIIRDFNNSNPTNLESLKNVYKTIEKIDATIDAAQSAKALDIKKYLQEKDYKYIDKLIDSNTKKTFDNHIDTLVSSYAHLKIIYTFLKENTDYKIEDSIIFTKKDTYNKFKDLVSSSPGGYIFNDIDYKLIEDNKDKEKNTDNKTNKETKTTVKDNKNNTKTEKIKSSAKYYIEIIRNHNVVIVYEKDNDGNYSKIAKVFVCSVGKNNKTPTGTFTTSKGFAWGTLVGGVYGRYSTRIYKSILFHSVPYYTKNKDDIEWEEYNKLGTAASLGCIRMTLIDVKWIYDNCGSGVTVKIFDGNLPDGVTKPTAPKIDGTSKYRGWDPTDPEYPG